MENSGSRGFVTEQEERYFAELAEKHKRAADMLSESFLDGVWDGVVNKYSDQAHFIYELLQNADDVHAEHSRFILYSDKLLFAHDGKKHFTISNYHSRAVSADGQPGGYPGGRGA